jgi:hypothetical protein
MSKILKRPMFRKGGEVMEGIMTGIKPRQNYSLGERVEEYKNVMRAATAGPGSSDPLARFLIETGQGLVGGAGADRGSRIAEILGATEKPTQNLFAALDKKAAQEKSIGLQSAILGIKGDQAIKKAAADKYLKKAPLSRIKQDYVDRYTKMRTEYIKNPYGKIPLEAKYIEELADFNTYQKPKLKEIPVFKGKNIEYFPYTTKRDKIEFNKDAMMAGTIYYKPDQQNFMYERVIDDDGNPAILIYDIATGKILKDTRKK